MEKKLAVLPAGEMHRFKFKSPIVMINGDTLHIKYSGDKATAIVVRNKKVIRRAKLKME
jgi:hypothetical protein